MFMLETIQRQLMNIYLKNRTKVYKIHNLQRTIWNIVRNEFTRMTTYLDFVSFLTLLA